jgi:hypothetical protein
MLYHHLHKVNPSFPSSLKKHSAINARKNSKTAKWCSAIGNLGYKMAPKQTFLTCRARSLVGSSITQRSRRTVRTESTCDTIRVLLI